jgi:hypothetical protein
MTYNLELLRADVEDELNKIARLELVLPHT